jgi:hypothetical protein
MIKKYDQFINEEEGRFKNILLSAIFSLGLKLSDAQVLKSNQKALSIIDTCSQWNNNIHKKNLGVEWLKAELNNKVDNPGEFINQYFQFRGDKTIVIRPQFIEDIKHHKSHGFEIDLNPTTQEFGLHYILKF